MRQAIALTIATLLTALWQANAAEPVLAYTFTGKEIGMKGQYAVAPQWQLGETPLIRVLDDGSWAAGLKRRTYLELPDARALHGDAGLTLFAEVRFNQPVDDKDNKLYDMIIFKDKEFLLGRSQKWLYFNLALNGNWALRINAPQPPVGRFVKLAVVLAKAAEEQYTYKLFIDGKEVAKGESKGKYIATDNPLRLFIGWGKQWLFGGDIRQVAIYAEPLSDDVVTKF